MQPEPGKHIIEAAEVLWQYMKMGQPLSRADAIIAMGSHDLRVAEYAAGLFLAGWAPWLVCSGGLGRLTRDIWHEPEARLFAQVALQIGVPPECILVEDRSTNTSENILFSRQLLREAGIEVNSVILVQKPYMERRAYATCRQYWPEVRVTASSLPLSLAKYCNEAYPLAQVIDIMVGDFQRILIYPQKGFQVPQPVPPEAVAAFKELVAAGFSQSLIDRLDTDPV